MIYSYRNSLDYRTDKEKSYRLGYAESKNGIIWKRKDNEIGIKMSEKGWDDTMMEYSTGYVLNNKHYLFFNGNGFGKEGFGIAKLMKND